MKLSKIEFVAYKSLVRKELVIEKDCIGFVGTNESGKTNVLSAISKLNSENKLAIADTPKKSKELNPCLKFHFELTDKENVEFRSFLTKWFKNHSILLESDLSISPLKATYTILFDQKDMSEKRTFSYSGLGLSQDALVLKPSHLQEDYKIVTDGQVYPLFNALLVKDSEIRKLSNDDIYVQLQENKGSQIAANSEKEKLEALLVNIEDTTVRHGISPDILQTNIEKINTHLDSLRATELSLEELVKEFNLLKEQQFLEEKIKEKTLVGSQLETQLNDNKIALSILKGIDPPTEEQIQELRTKQELIDQLTSSLAENSQALSQLKEKLDLLRQPLRDKYSPDHSLLNAYLDTEVTNFLETCLPNIVFWENSEKYILPSETAYSDILNKDDLTQVPRSLLNIFRLGLGIKTLTDLKQQIALIQNDPSERSRLQSKMNRRINQFIKNVWEGYDQELNIPLERDQIRVEIYDKNTDDPSYFSMEERSQGFKTFLSFLLTVGAETDQGVITKTILVLDEPELHLHPSGVRFMLKELIEISKKSNLVFYATHSIFLIDRSDLDRHVILKREKEETNIIPANVGRVGYFMQEEVLFNILDLSLGKDFANSKSLNFVFEGDGDAVLFDYYYTKFVDEKTQFELKKATAFHQGGKCSDIQEYFKKRGMRLGEKWIFILDSDKPADQLKNFLKSQYKHYIDREIFIYQYEVKGVKGDINLEDLIPKNIIIDAYLKAASDISLILTNEEISEIIDSKTYNDYSGDVAKKAGDDKIPFTAKFKEHLNKLIKEAIGSAEIEEQFKAAFEEYYNWVEQIKNDLAKAAQEQKKNPN